MALAHGNFEDISHQLRFLLFEIGIGVSQKTIEEYIHLAHQQCLKKLQNAAHQEQYSTQPIITHHVHDWIEQLQLQLKSNRPQSRFFAWDKLQHQCNEAIANTALSYAYKTHWNKRLKKELTKYNTLWAWINEQPIDEALVFLEQWGHPNELSTLLLNSQRAYNRRELLQYSPQFQAQLSLHWVAVQCTQTDQTKQFNELLRLQFPHEYSSWQNKLLLHRAVPEHYYPVAVDPWLWRTQSQHQYAPLCEQKSIILLPHHQKVRPTMTPTVFMTSNTHFDLQLGTPEDDDDDKMRQLDTILKQQQHYDDSLFITHTSPHSSNMTKGKQTLYPGFCLRQNPIALVDEEQITIPLPSLFTQSPLSSALIIDELISASGLNPVTFLIEYCQMVLLGPLHLLLKHNLSYKAEASAMTLLIKNHRPQALIIREIKQIEYTSHQSMGVETTSAKQRQFFIHTMIQNNLCYWINQLQHHYHINPSYLWKKITHVLSSLFHRLSNDLPETFLNEQKRLLLTEPWYNEPILSHLLIPHHQQEKGAEVNNPFTAL